MPGKVAEIEGVWCLGRKAELRGVDLILEEGKAYALIGDTKAGSLVFDLLLGWKVPLFGSVRVLGKNPAVGSRVGSGKVGYVFGEKAFSRKGRLSAALWEMWRNHPDLDLISLLQSCRQFGLHPDGEVEYWSAEQRFLWKAMWALACHPKLLLLDLASQELDSAKRREVLRRIPGVLLDTGTVLFTSRHPDEDADVADEVIGLDRGVILFSGPGARWVDYEGWFGHTGETSKISKAWAPKTLGSYSVRLRALQHTWSHLSPGHWLVWRCLRHKFRTSRVIGPPSTKLVTQGIGIYQVGDVQLDHS